MVDASRLVSVVIPAHNEAAGIGALVRAVHDQGEQSASADVEVIVVDDNSSDGTVDAAREAGAKVVQMGQGQGGNPAAARNRGADASHGDPIIFLDADCTPKPGWLEAILAAHDRGAIVVGGALDLPPGLSWTARCDYYCGWYVIHSRVPRGEVPHHPPPNLSVRRASFFSTSRFTEREPFSYTNEERAWQAELRQGGERIVFEPAAVVHHHNRPGFRNMLKRNYRWGYTAIEGKQLGTARMAWLYRHPRVLIAAAAGPLAFAHTAYIVGCWTRARVYEPILMVPWILVSRFAYTTGMMVGGIRWLRRRNNPALAALKPRWQ